MKLKEICNCWKIIELKMVKLEVTQKCNSRCLTCSTWKISRQTLAKEEAAVNELSLDEHIRIVEELKSLGCQYIELHGGEPTLYPHLPELISHCTSLGISTFFSTNGLSLTKDQAEKITAAGISRVNFSLDGPRECHNKLKGRPDAFKRQMESIRFLCSADPGNKILKTFNTIVSPYNIRRICEVVDIAAENKILMINFMFPGIIDEEIARQTNEIFGEKVASCRIITSNQLRLTDPQLIDRTRKALKEKARKSRVKLSPTKFFINRAEEIAAGIIRNTAPCWDIYGSCTIDAFGNVVPCELLRFKLGNVMETPLKKIFQNERYSRFTQIYARNYEKLKICNHCVEAVY